MTDIPRSNTKISQNLVNLIVEARDGSDGYPLTFKQISEILNVSTRTLMRWQNHGLNLYLAIWGMERKKEDLTHDEQLKLQLFERLTELKYPDVVEAREQIETLSREEYYAMVEKGVQRDRREKQRQEVLQKARREDREHARAQMKRLAMVKAWDGMFEITLSSIKRLNEQEERAKAELNKIESRIARLKEEEKQKQTRTKTA